MTENSPAAQVLAPLNGHVLGGGGQWAHTGFPRNMRSHGNLLQTLSCSNKGVMNARNHTKKQLMCWEGTEAFMAAAGMSHPLHRYDADMLCCFKDLQGKIAYDENDVQVVCAAQLSHVCMFPQSFSEYIDIYRRRNRNSEQCSLCIFCAPWILQCK